MAKQKPKAKGSRKRSDGQSTAQESKPNLFERLYNRKKFDILGKKAKGERKHGQSVHDAVDKVMPHAVAAVEPVQLFVERKAFDIPARLTRYLFPHKQPTSLTTLAA